MNSALQGEVSTRVVRAFLSRVVKAFSLELSEPSSIESVNRLHGFAS